MNNQLATGKAYVPMHFGAYGASGLSFLVASWTEGLKMLALFYWASSSNV